jgi:hypothetical protein
MPLKISSILHRTRYSGSSKNHHPKLHYYAKSFTASRWTSKIRCISPPLSEMFTAPEFSPEEAIKTGHEEVNITTLGSNPIFAALQAKERPQLLVP